MKIKTIEITGYRQIRKAKINMESNITIIAGANNSGKTSLVELFNCAFGSSKGKLCCDDLSVIECHKWSTDIYPHILAAFSAKKSKEDTIADVSKVIFSVEDPSKAVMVQPIEIKIQIDYTKDVDDIRNFADYIMDFDPDSTSFYFIYQYAINPDSFKSNLDNDYDKYIARFSKLDGTDKDKETIRIIKEMLISLYAKSSEETVYFSDKLYENRVQMDVSSFKKLFNYRNIMAGRTLDDESSDRTQVLSKNMIDIASDEDDWKDLISTLPDQIIQPIQDARIQEKVRAASLDTLSDTIESISKTNGGHTGNIVIDMNVTEDAIQALLKNITCAKYQTEEYYLKESSQGLGYSNLIYIHLQLEKYRKTVDPLIVNFFVIEEPEAHMHPQMQHVFTQYLFDYYNKQTEMQGCITTHSHEVIRVAKISQLRVLRQTDKFECRLFDLREFNNSISGNKDLLQFYDWFYAINFPDILFADKIIMYEGDTERMLIKSLLSFKDFDLLRGQYISFVQVGGAYAFNYKPIVEFLAIKTAILTDLDYDKDSSKVDDILKSGTTNSAIKSFAEQALKDGEPTVEKLYDWQAKEQPIVIAGLICLAFQGKKDGYSRTLEEAMLSKYYGLNSFDMKTKAEWEELRKKDNLKYTIPRTGEEFNLRDIVLHTSTGKTDFMYSVILNNLIESMLPEYIKEALLWLAK
ncbi:AAA family ATPase [Pelotomaculum terephthalicicum JT]|uniref:AAA family ATPase n=1 Tax=Pelotomaculum terephthalicicum TaxID=206393 RepID=UPI001F03864C|nr:AAA family ATPase [Pelotomaculum terephthalicicum]MCG9969897.1 AAA family ATPase [Pelotomaculum terephthalicicum JT]